MYKYATYKEKYRDLNSWMPTIIESIKRDLKNEHLKKDFYFIKKFLQSKNINKISVEELVDAYSRAIQEEEKGEELAEFLTARWLLKHSEIYDFFETYLNEAVTDFTILEELEEAQAHQLMEIAIERFGAPNTYLFAVLNSVVFPKVIFEQLGQRAQEFRQNQDIQQAETDESLTIEKMKQNYEREMMRLTDKYEKKLSGLQKKYLKDVEGFKKQIANLQRKLQEK